MEDVASSEEGTGMPDTSLLPSPDHQPMISSALQDLHRGRDTDCHPPSLTVQNTVHLEQEAYQAILEKNSEKLLQLLHAGLGINHCFSENLDPTIANESLLQVVIKENFDPAVELILLGNHEPVSRHSAQIAFLYAMRHNMENIIRIFLLAVLEDKIEMDLADAFRHAMYKAQYDLVAKIIEKPGFNVDLEATWGLDKPLHIVVHHNRVDLVELLLQRGARVDSLDRKGTTPLIISCSFGSTECTGLLLRHGANPNHKACRDLYPHHSPLHAVYRYFFLNPDGPAESIVEMLLQSGLNMRKELWINSTGAGPALNQNLIGFLKFLCKQPPDLKISCFVRIRQQIFHVLNGTSILSALDSLPIAPGLKHYLRLDDIL